jgi:fluoroquinolone transport system permease protein
MNRLLSTLRWDMVIQYRHGFYFASAFFVVVWVALLSQLPPDSGLDLARLIPALMLLNLIITTFYYMGALVLLEKADGALVGMVVSPLRDYEYLAAKTGSLTLLGLAESLLIVVAVARSPLNWGFLVGGATLLGCFYTLIGFVAIVGYDSINEYLMPSVPFVILLILPVIDHLGLWQSPLFYLHPVQPMLVLMRGAFAALEPWEVVYGSVGSLAWLGIALYSAQRRFDHFVVRTAGE